MLRSFITAALLLFVFTGHAQPNTGGPTPVNGAPLDGGLSLLVAGGAAYAVRRLRQNRHK